ncbi:Myeloid-associated differentiation marker-like protein 2 [Bagarius yarrelli]|uniref:Myeloid-associated differentiation marker-like protein 2 n=1 Tax=Bagarius yarrelli TaxID=175774 RepID=A0A556U0S1_BAGYA|nr:Myeloid-associated differentiation marker-like protein 2 [Bagarius yarrelli]
MAASSTAVSVLAPNGRRQTVKVSQNTPLLQVLEEVCRKQGFNPEDHGLKFQRNVLDLTLQWRFANLPNNAKLEIVSSSRQRGGADSTVRIALQLEDGSRLQGSFPSSHSLWDLLSHFQQTSVFYMSVFSKPPGNDLVISNINTILDVPLLWFFDISGEEALRKTSLRSLGLTGGSAILRFVLKLTSTPENNEPMETAITPTDTAPPASQPSPGVNTMPSDEPNEPEPAPMPIETPSPPSQNPEAASQMCQSVSKQQEQAEPSQDQSQAVQPKVKQTAIPLPQEARSVPQVDEEQPGPSHKYLSQSATPSNFVPFSGGGQRLGGSGAEEQKESPSPSSSSSSPLSGGPPKAKKAKPSRDIQRSSNATCGAKDSEDAEEYLEPVDREPLVFHLDTLAQRHCDDKELPDEFFEVTVDDVRKRFAQLKSERRVLEEAPLMTQALREAQRKEKMDRYPKVVLRVQFPDRQVLQGFFRPLETVIAPPKTKLDDPTATLFQANLFPAALVYFGSDVKTESSFYVNGNLKAQMQYYNTKLQTLKVSWLLSIPRSPVLSSSSLPSEESLPLHTESNGASRDQVNHEDQNQDEQNQAPKLVRTDPAKVPKWLKLPVVHGAGYSAVYGIFCMVAWSICFALSAAIFSLDVTRLHSCLPVSWENLTVTLAALSALLNFTASIVYPVYFVRNECPYNDCEVRNFRIAVTVCSWAAFFSYIAEVCLSRTKPARSPSYMSTSSGLLKVLQAYVGCAIFITLANGSEFWRHPATVYCVAVFVLCFVVTVLVVVLSVLGRTTFLSLPLERFVVLYTFAAVLLYVSAAVTWPVFCFDRKYGTPLRPQGCPGGKCAWDSQLVVTVFCFLNLAFYIADLCCSQRARFVTRQPRV